MKLKWIRGGRCASCGRRWRLRRLYELHRERPDPVSPAPDKGPPWPRADDVTRFDLIRRHPYLPDGIELEGGNIWYPERGGRSS
jgi:hypothetical protein